MPSESNDRPRHGRESVGDGKGGSENDAPHPLHSCNCSSVCQVQLCISQPLLAAPSCHTLWTQSRDAMPMRWSWRGSGATARKTHTLASQQRSIPHQVRCVRTAGSDRGREAVLQGEVKSLLFMERRMEKKNIVFARSR